MAEIQIANFFSFFFHYILTHKIINKSDKSNNEMSEVALFSSFKGHLASSAFFMCQQDVRHHRPTANSLFTDL